MARKRGKAKHKSRVRKTKKPSSKRAKAKRKPAKAGKPKAKKKRLRIISRPKVEEKISKPPHELVEEFYFPSPIHRGKYRVPTGIRFLIGYLSFLALLYIISFIYGVTFPTTILFGKMVTGTRALVINSVLLAIVFLMIYGFWKRKSYSFDLSIVFFSFTALNAFISLMLFDAAEHPTFRNLLLLSFISLVVMNIVIVWYILHEKKYFYVEQFKERPLHHRDKVFLYTIITFWAVALLIGGTLGVQFYKDTTRMIDQTVEELKGDYYKGQLLCEMKYGPEKDVCLLVIATAMSEYERPEAELIQICDSIESDFYQFTCKRSISK
ncbi:DUF2127 domain-containing protein [Candidatus Woesearchaeota archaeon]|nr:DUF2127 domain-containing protein [Candidatus Woesearchaeota archaeon]